MRHHFHTALTEKPKIKRPYTERQKAFMQKAKHKYANWSLENLKDTDESLLESVEKAKYDDAWRGVVLAGLKLRDSQLGGLFETMDRL